MALINFDANATWGLLPEVAADLRPYLAELSSGAILNPSSIHMGGQNGKEVLDAARQAILELVGASAEDRVIFTSGATEANNLAITQMDSHAEQDGALIISRIEHPSILVCAERRARRGLSVRWINPNGFEIDCNAVEAQLGSDAKLVSLMLANNETGVITDLAKIVPLIRTLSPRTIIHSDIVQAVGRLPLNFSELDVDMISLSAHKIGGLAGVGALVVRAAIAEQIIPNLLGGPQEGRARAGTENMLGIASFLSAAKIMKQSLAARIEAMEQRRAVMRAILLQELPYLTINATGLPTLPNTLSLTVEGILADDLVVALDLKGIAISSGSACGSGKPEPSHVLMGCGLSQQQARSTVRISIRAEDSLEQIICATEAMAGTIKEMRRG